ncbi:hypothetical protein ACMYR3_15125 [Ampullimonas aquatilis]
MALSKPGLMTARNDLRRICQGFAKVIKSTWIEKRGDKNGTARDSH